MDFPDKNSGWQSLEGRLAVSGKGLVKTGIYLVKGEFEILKKEHSGLVDYEVQVSDATGWKWERCSMRLKNVQANRGAALEAFHDLPVSLPECVLGVSVVKQSAYSTIRIVNYASFPGRFSVVIKRGIVSDYVPA